MIDLTIRQRQSPLAIIFLGMRIVRSLGIVQVAVALFFIVRGALDGRLLLVALIVLLLFAVMSALAWWRYTFQLVDGELVVNSGVFRVERLSVSVDRIQSMSIEQQLLHRLTGLVKVSVDTAGSTDAEFAIDAVSRQVAEELQRQAVITTPTRSPEADQADLAAPAAAEDVVFTHDPKRLVTAALTMWPWAGLVLLVPLFAVADEFREQASDALPNVDADGFQWWWVPIGIVGFLALSVLLNVARVFLRDWQLTLRASETAMRRTSGLLSRTSKASSVTRVQVVRSHQNPLQGRAGIRDVGLSTVGAGHLSLIGCDDGQFELVRVLAGVAWRDQLVLDRRVHPAQVWLAVRNSAVVAGAVAVGGFFLVGWWSVLVLGLVPVVWARHRRFVRNFRWSLGSELATTSRVIDASTRQALLRKTNAVKVSQTIFERRRGLGRVKLATAAGAISIGMIPIEEAEAVRDAILYAAETDGRPWM